MEEDELCRRMKEDWDRRISHDHRFWMSDGYQTDEVMWKSGERDFAILSRDIAEPQNKTILEIGCGVGRLLRAALASYKEVIGVDVSEVALQKSREFIGEETRLQLVQGNGLDLSDINDGAVDVVYSFASITSVPTHIIARYLLEANRVLPIDGTFRLQLYLGREQEVRSDDTLHLRCYEEENFIKAIEQAGFTVEWIDDLNLPFEVSFAEIGINAKIASFKKVGAPTEDKDVIATTLLPNGEPEHTDSVTGKEVEYWMTLNYAKELAEKGDIEHARKTLEFALAHMKTTALDVGDLLDQIIALIERKEGEQQEKLKGALESPEAPASASPAPVEGSDLFAENMRVLKDRFPEIYTLIESGDYVDKVTPEIQNTPEGDVIVIDGQVLDHPTAPVRSAESWVKNQLQNEQHRTAEALVLYGFGSGYHVEALLSETSAKLSVVEPSVQCFLNALKMRDLRDTLSRLENLEVGKTKSDISFVERTYLIVRPQTQAIFTEHCSKIKAQFNGARGLELLNPLISVLGPISGGTLPILGYTSHALSQLNQRVRSIDMSSFASGFKGLDDLVHDETRQMVIRGKYTEALSDIVLNVADERPMDILICMAQAPISGKALTELRKRGVITVLWFVEDYLRFPVWKFMSQYYDFIFTIQRGDCLKAIKAAGAGEVHYLPTAADLHIHSPQTLSPEEKARWGSPISFVGAGYHNRQQMFASLSHLPFKLWGTEWPNCKPFDRMVQEGGRRLKPEEYIKIFNATDININLHSSTERDGVDPAGDFLNPRTFELAACGAFQLVDEREYLGEVFTPGEDIQTFKDRNELLEKIEYFLAHPEERQKYIDRARARVIEEHTYNHRLQEMLSVIYSSKYEQLKRKNLQSPWMRMMKRAEPHPELKERCEIAYKRGEEPNLDGLVADIVSGKGKLTETEQKLLFLFHVRKQMIRMRHEERVKS